MAHALSLVGERWSLLVVGEFLHGPKRYTDLAHGLPESARTSSRRASRPGERRRDPEAEASAADARDRLRADGVRQGVERGVVCARPLGRADARPPKDDDELYPEWGVNALPALFNPEAARGLTETYVLKIDDDVFTARIVDGALAEAAWRCRGRGSRARDGHADVPSACPRRPRAAGRGGERLCPDRRRSRDARALLSRIEPRATRHRGGLVALRRPRGQSAITRQGPPEPSSHGISPTYATAPRGGSCPVVQVLEPVPVGGEEVAADGERRRVAGIELSVSTPMPVTSRSSASHIAAARLKPGSGSWGTRRRP